MVEGVGGAERDDGGGDLVERGDELGVERGEAWWFCNRYKTTLTNSQACRRIAF